MQLAKGYTRIIGILFLLVGVTLVHEFLGFGFSPELWHKMFHVIVGMIIIFFGWNNQKFWKPFCIVHGLFFLYIAAFGIAFPNFANLAAFNKVDTILHSIVGISGIICGMLKQ